MRKILGCLIVLILCIAIGAIEALVIQFLWNWIMPILWPNCPIFTFCEMWGLLILIGIIINMFKK